MAEKGCVIIMIKDRRNQAIRYLKFEYHTQTHELLLCEAGDNVPIKRMP